MWVKMLTAAGSTHLASFRAAQNQPSDTIWCHLGNDIWVCALSDSERRQ